MAGRMLDDLQDSDLLLDEQVDPDQQVEDEELGEDVEERLEVAAAYKTLLTARLFEADGKAERIVQRRVRDFIRTEIKNLLGMQRPEVPAEVVPPQFSDEEAEVLRAIVARALRRPQEQPAPKPTPQPRPVVAAPPVRQQQRAPTPAPARQAPPRPQPPAPTPKTSANRKDEVVMKTATPGERIVIRRQGGRRVRIYEQSGEEVMKQDLSPQVRPASALPAQTIPQMEAGMMALAQNTIEAQENSPVAQRALGALVKK